MIISTVCNDLSAAIPGVKKPGTWKVYYSNDFTFENASSLRYADKEYTITAGKTPVRPVLMKSAPVVDLGKGRKFTVKTTAVMVGTMHSDAPRSIYIGIGADWWSDAFCNGKYIGGSDENGNDHWPPSPQDHIFRFDLRKGNNDIVIRVRSGLASWKLAVDFFEKCDDPDLLPVRRPVPGIAFGPYLTNPGKTSATITYLLNGRQPMELEYREAGTEKWTCIANLRGGQIVDETPLQHFNLTDLKPDTTYEYRAKLRLEPHFFESQPQKIHTFRTYSEKKQNFSFFVMSDTHDTQKRMKLARLRKLFAARPELLKSNIMMHLGDLNASGNISSFRNDVFDTMLKLIPSEVFMMLIRGNHEFEGMEAQQWMDHFAYAGDRSYGMFRIGEVCILMLDTGYHREVHPEFSALNRLDTLLEEEKKWLAEAVRRPEFTTAKYRIVMGHVAPVQDDSFHHMVARTQYMVSGVFKGNPTPCPIDLWVCGHTHHYMRMKPSGEWQFPVIVLSAGEAETKPGVALFFQVSNDKITIKALNGDGSIHDQYEIKK